MNLLKTSIFISFIVFIANVNAVEIKTDKQKLSYSMGIFFGQTVIRQGMEIDAPAFMQAVEDVLNKSEKKLSDDEMQNMDQNVEKVKEIATAVETAKITAKNDDKTN